MSTDQQKNFLDFILKLEQRLQLPLPGAPAHEPLRAIPEDSARLQFNHQLPPKPGSVLILLFYENGVIKFPLTKRATYKGTHSGQISLPGGKREPGETEIETALRECEEEIGVKINDVNVIGRLSEFHVIPSNFIVTPVVAFTRIKPNYIPDPVEVDTILQCSIPDLLSVEAIKTKEIVVANEFRLRAPHFEVEHQVVWGATAMILNEFRMTVKDVLG